MAAKVWDVIVVGGGIIGLNAAYEAAKAGRSMLLVEQFTLGHTRGSSHGQSRIIRKAYPDDHFAGVMNEGYDLWRELEKESGQELMITTGLLLLEKGAATELEVAKASLEKNGVPHEWLTAQQLAARYPVARFDNSYNALLDTSAGVLLSDKCIQVMKDLVVRHGGEIEDNVHIKEVYPGTIITVKSQSRTYQCHHLVIATGPWANDWMTKLNLNVPFKTMPGVHMFWSFDDQNPENFKSPTFPLFYDLAEIKEKSYYFVLAFPTGEYHNMIKTKPGLHLYWQVPGSSKTSDYDLTNIPLFEDLLLPTPECTSRFMLFIPQSEYPNMVKVVTRGEPAPFYCHPDERDLHSSQSMVDIVSRYISEHYPGVATKPSIVEPCMYCMTPDKLPVVDRHPKHSNIIIGTGFSGRGFMMAPLAGKWLYELVSDNVTHDLQRYRLSRFPETAHYDSKL